MPQQIRWLDQFGKHVETRKGVSGTIVQIDYDTVTILTEDGKEIPIAKEYVIL